MILDMYTQSQCIQLGRGEEEFGRPSVESIMRCEDFKSNFARKLSNRYISRVSVSASRPDEELKYKSDETGGSTKEKLNNIAERKEACAEISKIFVNDLKNEEKNSSHKPQPVSSDMRRTEASAINIEIETLRWQLTQTEANRQVHIALLKQIVFLLNRVKEHIESQKKNTKDARFKLSQSATRNTDLPRSRSVFQVNRSLELSLTPPKQISGKKISMSVSNVAGFKDYYGVWHHPKLTITSETSAKLHEELTRVIVLANTVLSTKLPDLSNAYNDSINTIRQKTEDTHKNGMETSSALNHLENKEINKEEQIMDTNTSRINNLMEIDGKVIENEISRSLYIEKESSSANFSESNNKDTLDQKCLSALDTEVIAPLYIEGESGFSSMSSFQEIGIPIISIISPSPCKQMEYIENMPMLDDVDKWKVDSIDVCKQQVKVFWV